MNLPEVKIDDLLESGVHFGHNVRRWNPKMEEYIFGVRNNIHIFDLRITVEAINSALIKLHETVSKSGKVLFVGTKKQCSIVVKELAELNNYFYVNKRWLGGMLTNWKTISKSINRLKDLETFLSDPSSSNNIPGATIAFICSSVLRMNSQAVALFCSIFLLPSRNDV